MSNIELLVLPSMSLVVLLALGMILRRLTRQSRHWRHEVWRQVPPPNWACKRGGVELW